MLDEIEGIGPKRRLALIKEFKTIDNIKNADIDQLKEAPSMNVAAAQKVYEFFH